MLDCAQTRKGPEDPFNPLILLTLSFWVAPLLYQF